MSLSGSFTPLAGDTKRAADVALYDANGNQLSGFDSSRPANSTPTNVTAAAVNTQLLAANLARRRITIWNNSNKTMFVTFGAAATLTSGFPIPSQGVYQGPLNDFTGVVNAIWAAGPTGAAEIQEITT